MLRYLASNLSRLAEEISFVDSLPYPAVERAPLDLTISLVKRFSDLIRINVDEPVQDIERFLDFLKSLNNNITGLRFSFAQPQELFDRLFEHYDLQRLTIKSAESTVADLEFLCRFKNLVVLRLNCSIDTELIRKMFEQLKFLSTFEFKYRNNRVVIVKIDPKQYKVWMSGKKASVCDLNAAIQLLETP